MISGRKVLALVPARGGSKGIPRKNIRPIAGKPLIAWILEEAKKSRYIDRLVVSSEDEEILETSRRFGAETPFARPAELARDDSPDIEVVLHAIGRLPGFDYLVELQATSPLCTVEDIDGCIELLDQSGAQAVLSVVEAQPSPYWMFRLDESGSLGPLLARGELPARRQDLPPVYALNGAVSAARIPGLQERRSFLGPGTKAFLMPPERSVDIDDGLDWALCDLLLRREA